MQVITGMRPVGIALAWVGLLLGTAGVYGQDQLPPLPPPVAIPEPKEPPPSPRRVFRLESDAQLIERMVEGSKTADNPLHLKYRFMMPDYAPVPPEEYVIRGWSPLHELVEPPVMSHNRLFFEQINAERYGWDLGVIHPVLSAGIFYWDVVTLPYRLGTEPCRKYESDAGYCLPGDPVPLLLYPPEWSWTGLATEAAVIGVILVAFP